MEKIKTGLAAFGMSGQIFHVDVQNQPYALAFDG